MVRGGADDFAARRYIYRDQPAIEGPGRAGVLAVVRSGAMAVARGAPILTPT